MTRRRRAIQSERAAASRSLVEACRWQRCTSLQLSRLRRSQHRGYGDGAGLYLIVSKSGGRVWAFFYTFQKRRREMRLGHAADMSLAKARERATECRVMILDGVDPLARRFASLSVKQIVPGETFGDVAEHLLSNLEPGWRNPKHRQQWRNTLKHYCSPIWGRPVSEIETGDVIDVLKPVWLTKPETARRVRGRIQRVLAAAKVLGKRTGENPARWKEHLEYLMPARSRRLEKKHRLAMPYEQIADFVRSLCEARGTGACALRFTILTAVRTTESLGATWREFDLKAKLWTIPKERMKLRIEHRVPLSEPAVAVLQTMADSNYGSDAYVFPGMRSGRPLSDMTMTALLRRVCDRRFTVHGMRSTFRDWCGEETEFPREIAEAALAHSVGNEVERAYRRGDALKKRRVLMDAWGAHCVGEEPSVQ